MKFNLRMLFIAITLIGFAIFVHKQTMLKPVWWCRQMPGQRLEMEDSNFTLSDFKDYIDHVGILQEKDLELFEVPWIQEPKPLDVRLANLTVLNAAQQDLSIWLSKRSYHETFNPHKIVFNTFSAQPNLLNARWFVKDGLDKFYWRIQFDEDHISVFSYWVELSPKEPIWNESGEWDRTFERESQELGNWWLAWRKSKANFGKENEMIHLTN